VNFFFFERMDLGMSNRFCPSLKTRAQLEERRLNMSRSDKNSARYVIPMHRNNVWTNKYNAQSNHNTGYTWFTPMWGYVHQLFSSLLSSFNILQAQSHKNPLCIGQKICAHLSKPSFPKLGYSTKPLYSHFHLALQVLMHTVCTKLTQPHRSN